MNRLLVGLIGAGFWTGCGGSEPAASTESPSSDASSTTGAGGTNEAGAAETSTASEAGFDLDAFPIPDGPIGACAACIRDMCQADLATCATDPKCQMGVICTIQNCAQYAMGEAGAAGLVCITNCFGDLPTALSALNGLTCVTTKCDACSALLDGGGSALPDGGGTAPLDGGGTD